MSARYKRFGITAYPSGLGAVYTAEWRFLIAFVFILCLGTVLPSGWV